MGYLDDIEPGVRKMLESRKLFLRVRGNAPADPPDELVVLVCWDDGGDDSGLPVGHVRRTRYRRGVLGRTVEFWTAHAQTDPDHPRHPEVARHLDNINDAVRQSVLHIASRYS